MEHSNQCLKLAETEEGCKLKAYHGRADRPGLYTIGFGTIQYPNGKVVMPGDTCTQEEANQWLDLGLTQRASIIDAAITHAGKTLSQNQFDSLVDFAYNEGVEGLVYKSTLFKKALANSLDPSIWQYSLDTRGVPQVNSCEFLKWVYAAGVIVDDLIWRRAREADMYAGKPFKFKA